MFLALPGGALRLLQLALSWGRTHASAYAHGHCLTAIASRPLPSAVTALTAVLVPGELLRLRRSWWRSNSRTRRRLGRATLTGAPGELCPDLNTGSPLPSVRADTRVHHGADQLADGTGRWENPRRDEPVL